MKVRVGDKIYDGEKEPVMVLLTTQDKCNISNMSKDDHRYCQYPEDWTRENIWCWLAQEQEIMSQ